MVRVLCHIILCVVLSVASIFGQSNQNLNGGGAGTGSQDLDTFRLFGTRAQASLENVDSLHEMDLSSLDTKRSDEEIQDLVNDLIYMGSNGLLQRVYDDGNNRLYLHVVDRTLSVVNDSLTILGGNKIALSDIIGGGGGDVYKSGTPLLNQHAKWINDSTIIGTPVVTDNGTDVTISGRMGVDGSSPTPGYSIWSSGHIVSGTLPDYTWIKANGEVEIKRDGIGYRFLTSGGSAYFQRQGTSFLQFDAQNDVNVYNNMTVTNHLGVNSLEDVNIPFRMRGEGSTYATSNFYIDAANGTRLIEVRDDGALEGETINKWLFPLNNGVVGRAWSLNGYVADPYLNNYFYNATRRLDVTYDTLVSPGSLPNWFDGGYAVGVCRVPQSDTTKLNFVIANNDGNPVSGITYPQGYVYVYTYSGHLLSPNSFIRVKDNSGTWHDNPTNDGLVFSAASQYQTGTSSQVYRFRIQGSPNYVTEIEVNLVNDNAFDLIIQSIEYYPERNTGLQLPVVTKYADQILPNKFTWANSLGSPQVTIDPNAVYDLLVDGSVRINGGLAGYDGSVASPKMTYSGDPSVSGKIKAVFPEKFNSYLKARNNTATSNNLNPTSGYTDITNVGTLDYQYGTEVISLTFGNFTVPINGIYGVGATFSLISGGACEIMLRIFVNGTATGTPVYVKFAAAERRMAYISESVLASASQVIDIRSTRVSGSAEVNIGGTDHAHIEVNLKTRI